MEDNIIAQVVSIFGNLKNHYHPKLSKMRPQTIPILIKITEGPSNTTSETSLILTVIIEAV